MSLKLFGGTIQRFDDDSSSLTSSRGVLNKVPQAEYEKIVADVMDDIYQLIVDTIGPNGWTILVTEPYGASPVFPNKDGFRALLNVKYDNPLSHTFYQVLRDCSVRLNTIIGDATTSVIAYVVQLFKNLLEVRRIPSDFKIAPTSIRHILSFFSEVIKDMIKDNPTYIKSLDVESTDEAVREQTLAFLEKVAMVSSNYDADISKSLIGIYRDMGFDINMSIEPGLSEESVIERDTGFELVSGYVLPSMVTEQDGLRCSYDEPYYVMIDGALTGNDLHQFAVLAEHVCYSLKKPLVVIAESFTQEIINYFSMVRAGVETPSGMYRYPIVGILENSHGETFYSSRFLDIATILGATPLPTRNGKLIDFETMSKSSFMSRLGSSERFIASPHMSRFIGGRGSKEAIEGRIVEIEKEIRDKTLSESIHFQVRIANAKKRIAMLRGRMVSVKVGGQDFKSRQYFVLVWEDAFNAVRSAIQHGITLGGNFAIGHLLANRYDEIIERVYTKVKVNKIHVVFGNLENTIKQHLTNVLNAIGSAMYSPFGTVLFHAGFTQENASKLIDSLTGIEYGNLDESTGTPKRTLGLPFTTINIKTGENETLDTENLELVVPGNTDYEILDAAFAVCSNLLTSRSLMPMYFPSEEGGTRR